MSRAHSWSDPQVPGLFSLTRTQSLSSELEVSHNMECPQCQNTDSLRMQLAWQSQVSHTQIRGRFMLGVVATEDGLMPGLGYQPRFQSTHKTDLSRSLEPPVEPPRHRIQSRLWAAVASYFLGSGLGILFILLVILLIPHPSSFMPLVFVGAIGGFVVAWRHFRSPPKDWPAQQNAYERNLRRWQNEWFCPRCGYRWQPTDRRPDIKTN